MLIAQVYHYLGNFYSTENSFAKAFQKFHGVLPSQAKNNGSSLKFFSRLVLKFSLEGGTVMNYRIEEKDEMVLTGYKRRFVGDPSDRYHQQHNFMVDGETRFIRYALQGMAGDCSKEYGVIFGFNDDGYDYLIGTEIPMYFNNHLVKTVGAVNADKLAMLRIQSHKYLVVNTGKSALSIQNHLELRKQAIAEWFAGSEYQLANAPEITVFHYDLANHNNSFVELWLPIQKTE